MSYRCVVRLGGKRITIIIHSIGLEARFFWISKKNCQNRIFGETEIILLCINFISENFIKNFSILYSPLKRHLVDDPSVHFHEQRVIIEVTTNTFHDIVFLSDKVHLITENVSCKSWLGLLRGGSHSFFTLMCFAFL